MKCNKCKGEGILRCKFDYIKCNKCKGLGKLDWIENIVGKKRELNQQEECFLQYTIDTKKKRTV